MVKPTKKDKIKEKTFQTFQTSCSNNSFFEKGLSPPPQQLEGVYKMWNKMRMFNFKAYIRSFS